MGKGSQRKKKTAVFDSDDDSVSTSSTSMSDVTQVQEEEVYGAAHPLENYLDALYEKRGSTREKALVGLVDAFMSQVQSQFVESNYVTLQHQLTNSIKRGSALEASLASHALGLLAISVGPGDITHEIMEESVSPLSQALKSGSDERKRSSLLECLAIVTFVGGNDFEETQTSMQVIWQLIHPKSGSNVGVASKPSPAVLATAVAAWSFLLTTIDGWRMSSSDWQEYISYLSTLLDKDDRAVRKAAGEAIALIFETKTFGKVSKEVSNFDDDDMAVEGKSSLGAFTHVEALKGKILSQVRNLSVEAGGKGLTKKDLNSQRSLFREILEFLETGYCPETSVKMQHGDSLVIASWTQLIQLNFLKHFLRSGFLKHMQENELLHDVFNFSPKKKQSGANGGHLLSSEKRMFKSPNSFVNKARTQLLNKQRMLAQDRNTGHFSALMGDDA